MTFIEQYVTSRLHTAPELLTMPTDGERPEAFTLEGPECKMFGYYRSNEFYGGLADELRNLGGVGLAVGPDQGLDFRIMAGLHEVYIVDIDPNTYLITHAYLETGARLKKIIGRYPTVDEFTHMFREDVLPVTMDLLQATSTKYQFSQPAITWLQEEIAYKSKIHRYLEDKRRSYGRNTWIGNDETLRDTIQAYERGEIVICQGDIAGENIPVLAEHIERQGKYVSLIYISNDAIGSTATLERFNMLPLDDCTKLIYAARRKGFELVPDPPGFKGLLDWSMFMFSPTTVSQWPTSSDVSDYRKINPGCYVFDGAAQMSDINDFVKASLFDMELCQNF